MARHLKVLAKASPTHIGDPVRVRAFINDVIAIVGMTPLGEPQLHDVPLDLAKLGREPFEDEGGVTAQAVGLSKPDSTGGDRPCQCEQPDPIAHDVFRNFSQCRCGGWISDRELKAGFDLSQSAIDVAFWNAVGRQRRHRAELPRATEESKHACNCDQPRLVEQHLDRGCWSCRCGGYVTDAEVVKRGATRRSQDQNPLQNEHVLVAFGTLSTSHVALHTWPLREELHLDLYSCRHFDIDQVLTFLQEVFHTTQVKHADLTEHCEW